MPYTVIFDGDKAIFSGDYYSQAELTPYEIEAVGIIRAILDSAGIDPNAVQVERRTKSYLTLYLGDHYDFCRLKVTARTRWMSLDLVGVSEEVKSDERLSFVEDKGIRHWKIPLSDIGEIQRYADFIVASFKWCESSDQKIRHE